MPGRTLNGRYRLGRLLGRGGMAEVYEAHDELLDRPVAVKMLRPDMAAEAEVRSRFTVEARSAARLHHPNVVSVFDTGEDGGDPYLVMELLPGESLADRVGGGPVDPEWLRGVARDVLAALGAAHEAGLVHRDVKPGNVLLTADGQAKVADFGIAKSAEAVSGDMTSTGLLLGTPAYLAPERIEGLPATARSDLYSLGIVLYEALAGAKPFAGGNAMAVASAIVSSPPPPLEAARPGLDPMMIAAVERAMAKDPAQRPASAADMAADLGLVAPEATTVAMATGAAGGAAAGPDATMISEPGALGVPAGRARAGAAGGAGAGLAGAGNPVAAMAERFAGRGRLVAWFAAAAAVLVFVVLAASAGGGGGGADREALAGRLDDLAGRVEEGDGPMGREAAERLREVADQVEAGGGGDAATELLRDTSAWRASGQLSEPAVAEMVELLRQVPGVDATVLTTTTTSTLPPTTAVPPPPPEERGDEEEPGKKKGRGKGDD